MTNNVDARIERLRDINQGQTQAIHTLKAENEALREKLDEAEHLAIALKAAVEHAQRDETERWGKK